MIDWWNDPDPVELVAAQARVLIERGWPSYEALDGATRLWSKIDRVLDESSHWWWTGAQGNHGYGMFAVKKGRSYSSSVSRVAHRVVLDWTGDGDHSDLVGRHLCGQRMCNRPDHLAWGSEADNSLDAIKHGTLRRRSPSDYAAKPAHPHRVRGAGHPKAKLSEDDVRLIRKLWSEHKTLRELGVMFGVQDMTIHAVVMRRTWRHVD